MSTRRILTIAAEDGRPGQNDYLDRILDITLPKIVGFRVLDDRVLEGPTRFTWGEEGINAMSPLGIEDAEALMHQQDDNGTVQVTVLIDKEEFLDGYARAGGNFSYDHIEILYDLAFDFGLPYGVSYEIVGVSEGDFVVNLTADIDESIAGEREEQSA